MKAVLEFNLPEEALEHRCAIDGAKWRAVVSRVNNSMRDRVKYGDTSKPEADVIDDLRSLLWEEMQRFGLSLED